LPTVTIPRADLTSEDVTSALRAGLGPRYHVIPGMRMPQACLFAAEPNQDPDTILVSMGSSRFFRAQVTLTRDSGQTVIRIRPGGTSSEFPINALGIVRKIRQILSTPGMW
jgi:UDP:flavonoid glycosyltransferase YjiC (YdhE family)